MQSISTGCLDACIIPALCVQGTGSVNWHHVACIPRIDHPVAEWHDASEIQVVLRDDESATVSSEATTVVPGEEPEDGSTGRGTLVSSMHLSTFGPAPACC